MSGPHAAGAAAVFVQYYKSRTRTRCPRRHWSRRRLINSADELDEANGGPGPIPNNDEGWGRINLANIVVTNLNSAPRFYQYLDQTVLLTNSQVYSQHIFVQGPDQPLKITLAYTDVPGFPGAIPALVNDLDLEVVAPDGTLYRGNQFAAGESVPNAPSPDKLNNVEGVYLSQPAPGDYLVRVRASQMVQDAVSNTPSALTRISRWCRPAIWRGPARDSFCWTAPAYTAPGVMQIEVFDAARAASNSVSVLVTNLDRARLGRPICCTRREITARSPARLPPLPARAGAGQIQIANGDNLEADYFDSSRGKANCDGRGRSRVCRSSARVASSTDVGVLTITWQTSEPATSIVRYGTNSSDLNLGVTNLALVTSHVVRLTGLIPGKTYYLSDRFRPMPPGTPPPDNNGGAFYNFIGVATPTVLLVDAYDTAAEAANGSTVIPDSAYTNVLAAAGFSYGFWKVNRARLAATRRPASRSRWSCGG